MKKINDFEFEDFQKSGRVVSDLGKVLADEIYDGIAGFVYDGDCYISIALESENGKYHLLIERSEWQSDNLVELEETLWASHYVIEHDVTITRDSIDAFLRGYCRSINAECDGDLFGVIFSGEEPQEWCGPPLQDEVYQLAKTFKLFTVDQPPKVSVWLASMESNHYSWEAGGISEADALKNLHTFFNVRSRQAGGSGAKIFSSWQEFYCPNTREVSETFTSQM